MENEVVKYEEVYPVLGNPEEMRAVAEANLPGDLSFGDLPRIAFPASGAVTFRIPGLEGDTNAEEIVGIITAFQDVRGYWPGKFSGNEPPVCSSTDAKRGVGKPGGDCPECEMSAWDETTGRQSCKLMRRLYLIRPGHMIPTLVVLPPTSIKGGTRYFVDLLNATVPFYAAITRIGLRPEKSKDGVAYSVATFTFDGRLSPEAASSMKLMGQQYLNALGQKQVEK